MKPDKAQSPYPLYSIGDANWHIAGIHVLENRGQGKKVLTPEERRDRTLCAQFHAEVNSDVRDNIIAYAQDLVSKINTNIEDPTKRFRVTMPAMPLTHNARHRHIATLSITGPRRGNFIGDTQARIDLRFISLYTPNHEAGTNGRTRIKLRQTTIWAPKDPTDETIGPRVAVTMQTILRGAEKSGAVVDKKNHVIPPLLKSKKDEQVTKNFAEAPTKEWPAPMEVLFTLRNPEEMNRGQARDRDTRNVIAKAKEALNIAFKDIAPRPKKAHVREIKLNAALG